MANSPCNGVPLRLGAALCKAVAGDPPNRRCNRPAIAAKPEKKAPMGSSCRQKAICPARSAFIHLVDAISSVTMSVTAEFIPASPTMTSAALSYYRMAVATG